MESKVIDSMVSALVAPLLNKGLAEDFFCNGTAIASRVYKQTYSPFATVNS